MLALWEVAWSRVAQVGATRRTRAARGVPRGVERPVWSTGSATRKLFANDLAQARRQLSIARPPRKTARRDLGLAIAARDQPLEHTGELLVDLTATTDLDDFEVCQPFGDFAEESLRQFEMTTLCPAPGDATASVGSRWPTPDRTRGTSPRGDTAFEPLENRLVVPAHDHRPLLIDPDESRALRVDHPVGHRTLAQTSTGSNWSGTSMRITSATTSVDISSVAFAVILAASPVFRESPFSDSRPSMT